MSINLPRGIWYPVSPGFLKFLKTWSEWMFITIPVKNMNKPTKIKILIIKINRI